MKPQNQAYVYLVHAPVKTYRHLFMEHSAGKKVYVQRAGPAYPDPHLLA